MSESSKDGKKLHRQKVIDWCVSNAPEAYKKESEEFLMKNMLGVYDKSVASKHGNKVLYFGTRIDNFVPDPNHNNPDTDLGTGLYLTPSYEKAEEWSTCSFCKGEGPGYVYAYEYCPKGLNVEEIKRSDIMTLLTYLLNNRAVLSKSYMSNDIKQYFKNKYVNFKEHDVICSHRVDDGLSVYVRDFIQGNITDSTLYDAMSLGKLGVQYCLKTPKSLNNICLLYKFSSDISKGKLFDKRYKHMYDVYKNMPSKPGKYCEDYIK